MKETYGSNDGLAKKWMHRTVDRKVETLCKVEIAETRWEGVNKRRTWLHSMNTFERFCKISRLSISQNRSTITNGVWKPASGRNSLTESKISKRNDACWSRSQNDTVGSWNIRTLIYKSRETFHRILIKSTQETLCFCEIIVQKRRKLLQLTQALTHA